MLTSWLLLGCFISYTVYVYGAIAPAALKVEYQTRPLGVDVGAPRFFWQLESVPPLVQRGQAQSAYRITVTDAYDSTVTWDSGKVASAESIHIEYKGKQLKEDWSYTWQVTVWDQNDQMSTTESSTFGTAFFSFDFSPARWIGSKFDYDNQYRHTFEIPKEAFPLKHARAYIAGLGYYQLFVNGEKIGDTVLGPWTNYTVTILYDTWDVTKLQHGTNAVGVWLGNGFWKHYDAKNTKTFIFYLSITYYNGTKMLITSNDEWLVSKGPITADDPYFGEEYDARLYQDDWNAPGYTPTTPWNKASFSTNDISASLRSSFTLAPIRETAKLKPKSIKQLSKGMYVADLGQNMAGAKFAQKFVVNSLQGYCQISATGKKGDKIILRSGETLAPDGQVNNTWPTSAPQTDTFILRGGEKETFKPHFTYHGVQYVQIEGYPGTPTVDDLSCFFVHSDVPHVGQVTFPPGSILEKMQHATLWSQLSNLGSIPTDCPNREKHGWLGDAQLTTEEALWNFDMAGFYANFLQIIKDTQFPDGILQDFVPKNGAAEGKVNADPAWGTAYPQILSWVYQHYGDKRLVEEHYDGVKKYVDFMISSEKKKNDIVVFYKYGDWCSYQDRVYERETTGPFLGGTFYLLDILTLSRLATILGRTEDATKYSNMYKTLVPKFNELYYNDKSDYYGDGNQTMQLVPLHMEIAADSGAVLKNLVTDIKKRNTHLTTGAVGSKFLLDVLTQYKEYQLAVDLATQDTLPSWGYWMKQGATTCWENWRGKADDTHPPPPTHNHIFLCANGAWYYKSLVGINPAAPGFREIEVFPKFWNTSLNDVSASHNSLSGTVVSKWKTTRSPLAFTIQVTVPVNVKATVHVPTLGQTLSKLTIREGKSVVWDGEFVPGTQGVTGATVAPGAEYVVFRVLSGVYDFEV